MTFAWLTVCVLALWLLRKLARGELDHLMMIQWQSLNAALSLLAWVAVFMLLFTIMALKFPGSGHFGTHEYLRGWTRAHTALAH